MRAPLATLTYAASTVGATDVCCQAEIAECKACNAGMDVQKYCGLNRDTPGCDDICCDQGCSALCKRVTAGTIKRITKCPFKVVDETYNIFAPVILEADVESTCPFADYGKQNLEVCRDCSTLHKPCEDQYMACAGCACTDWHTELGLDIKTHHTCPELKQYFKTKNSAKVKCEDADMDDPDEPTEGKVHLNVTNKTAEATLFEGWVETECATDIHCLYCDKIPFKLKFECDACDLGVPKLLRKCCDKCVEWVKGLATDPTIPANIRGFGWCSGCHVDSLSDDIPWLYASLYANYTEEVADAGMERHIEENVCSLLTPSCGATTTEMTTTQMPSFIPEDETNIQFSPCMPGTGNCGGVGGRRLEFMEPATPVVDMKGNTSCTWVDAGRSQAQDESEDMNTFRATLESTTAVGEDASSSLAYSSRRFSAAIVLLMAFAMISG